MESYYLIKQGVTPSQASQPFNWIRLQSPSQEEINHAIERFQLPAESILSSHRPDEVARIELAKSCGI